MNKETSSNSEQEATDSTAPITLAHSVRNNAMRLGLFALACTFFIALTFISTQDDIAQRIREARLKALLEITPRDQHDNDLLKDVIDIDDPALGLRSPGQLFLAKQKDIPKTVIYPATARDGYSGDINYIIGINLRDNTIAGVRVISHKETPGLGDRVELRKSDWILGFNGKSLSNPEPSQWTVKKAGGSFDSFTGATITPRALVQSVADVLRYHQQNSDALLTRFKQEVATDTPSSTNGN